MVLLCFYKKTKAIEGYRRLDIIDNLVAGFLTFRIHFRKLSAIGSQFADESATTIKPFHVFLYRLR